ncbi:hypothetical protein K438DRAFT_1997841 [Mycena galopus ATCC 62051]|nr:hypothetical protein K438DRAFT_1997841 [Mycena galopus ATCC 62051]
MQQEFNVTSSTPIPSSLRCGELDVPMDYSKPFDSVTNNITIGFAMNRPTNPEGVIYYHPGGPGLEAVSQAWQNALNLSQTFTGLMDNFDILAINMRGLEFSTPLNCTSGVFFNNISYPFPTSEEEYNAYQVSMTNFFGSCNDTSPPGLMQFVSTADFMQDYDAMRAALGYETINFAGVSYGTFVGAAYIAKYPENSGRFVIDAVIPHGYDFQDMIIDQIVAVNRLLLRSDAFCMTDPTCPFYGQGKGSVAWETLLQQAIQEPLAAPGCGVGTLCNAPVTATDLRYAVYASFQSNPDFPLFNFALNQSLHGNATLFGYQPLFDLRETVVSPLLCSDFGIEDDGWKTFSGFNNFSLNASANDTASIVYGQNWQYILMCAAWPFKVPEQTIVNTTKEILWVTSDYDLNLPTELTTFAWQQTPNSTLLIRAGDDHTSINLDLMGVAGTAANLARGFLATGIMPAAQNTSQITVIPPGGTRGPVPDPYDMATGAAAGDSSVIENITTKGIVGSANTTASGVSGLS